MEENYLSVDEICAQLGIRKSSTVVDEMESQESSSNNGSQSISMSSQEIPLQDGRSNVEEIIIDELDLLIGSSIEISLDVGEGQNNAGSSINTDKERAQGPANCDNDQIASGSGLNEPSSEDHDQEFDEVFHGEINRKRKKKATPDTWKRNIHKDKRMKGQPYLGFQNKTHEIGDQRSLKAVHDKEREGVKIGLKCNSKLCKESKFRFCQDFSEEDREKIFSLYWNKMDWAQRKVYVTTLIDKIKVKVQTKGKISRRSETSLYFLKINDERIQVCKYMFMNTLKVTRRQIEYWTQKNTSNTRASPSTSSPSTSTHNSIQQNQNAEILKLFLNRLPKLPSHYTRKYTSKLYLEPIFNSVTNLFSVYLSKCKEEKQSSVSRWKFDSTLDEMNISLFKPKKDQCDTCIEHKVGNLSDEEFNSHILKKDRARTEKDEDKQKAKNDEIYCLTMDLESVKVAPCLQASALYYKTKLAVHNFTVYDIANNNASCFWWNESEAELVASSFASCIIDYLTEKCTEDREIVIYSDGCTYQNRNSIMSNALLNYSINAQKIVIQKYLEKGHTQMECDSVHSAIESKLKYRQIYLPSDYYAICAEARTKPRPYEVKTPTFDFFRDYSRTDMTRYKSIRPGKKVGDSTVTDIRGLKYTPEGIIYYKLEFDDEWKEIPIRPKTVKNTIVFPSLYENRLKIKERKYQDLQALKKVLPPECHSFYDQLPH